MKKALSSLCFVVAIATQAQTVVISDNFDSYTAGNQLAATSPLWITWTGAPTEDAAVSNAQSSSAPNSVYVIGNNGPTDLVLPFPTNYTTGIYEITFKIFMAPNKGGYFNLQGNITPGIDWMLEVYFNNAGGGYINAGGANAALISYNTSAWNDVRVQADLSGDEATLYINGNLVYTWLWSLGSDGTGAPVSWGGMNLYAAAATPGDGEYYIDDVVFSDVTPTGMKDNIALSGFGIYPNPATENFEVTYASYKNTSGTIQIINSVGEVVYEESAEFQTGTNRLPVSSASLSSGMYFIRLITGAETFCGKFMVD